MLHWRASSWIASTGGCKEQVHLCVIWMALALSALPSSLAASIQGHFGGCMRGRLHFWLAVHSWDGRPCALHFLAALLYRQVQFGGHAGQFVLCA